jgi:hypothetical protein
MKVYGWEVLKMFGLTRIVRMNETDATYRRRIKAEKKATIKVAAARKKVITCVIIVIIVTVTAFMVG